MVLPSLMTRGPLGARGEAFAARLLRRRGYTILAGGHRTRYGELDLIAVDHHGADWRSAIGLRQRPRRTVVFVEVKTRRSSQWGSPALAVDADKQRRLASTALAYLKANHLLEHPVRFDVVALVWPGDERRPTEIEHYRNAFEPPGRWQFYA